MEFNMSTVETVDLIEIIAGAISEVFATMLSMEVEILHQDFKEIADDSQINGLVDFNGDLSGIINIQVSTAFARLMAASMLGMDQDEIEGDEEVVDVIDEVINIISGNLKTALGSSGLSCDFSTPSITTVTDPKIKSLDFQRHERFAFRHQKYTGLVDLHIPADDTYDDKSEPADQSKTLGDNEKRDKEIEPEEKQQQEKSPEPTDQFKILDDTDDEEEESDSVDQFKTSEDTGEEEETPEPDEQIKLIDDTDEEEKAEHKDESDPIDQFKTLDDTGEEEETPEFDEQIKSIDDTDEEKEAEHKDESDSIDQFKTLDDTGEEEEEENEEEEEIEGGKNKRSLFIILSLAIVFLVACIIGFFIYEKRHKTPSEPPPSKQIDTHKPPAVIEKAKPAPLRPIDDRLSKITELRNKLLIKQKDITALKEHYQNGIDKVENDLIRTIRQKNVTSYKLAINDQRIRLGLGTIQRRRAYIQQLNKPYKRLYEISEELLYLKRRTEIDIKMVGIIQGMDMDKLIERIDTAIPEYLAKTSKLSINIKSSKLIPLENIWKEIRNAKKNPNRKKELLSQENQKNREISQEICNGNFDRKYELTELSPEAAECLSKWKGKDLFLNGLTSLSPKAAKKLSQWHGEWLSLNGLSKLSPEAAKYLSQWQGKWFSLNGLTELSPEVSKYLSQWNGNQIEMVSLKHMAEWEKSGGRLFIPEKFRKQIEQIIE